MKYLLLAATVTLGSAGLASADPFGLFFLGTGEMGSGVMCEVQAVKVLAASVEDCTKIGGKATHTVESTMKPIEQ